MGSNIGSRRAFEANSRFIIAGCVRTDGLWGHAWSLPFCQNSPLQSAMGIFQHVIHNNHSGYQRRVPKGISIAQVRLLRPWLLSDKCSCNCGCCNFSRMDLLNSGAFH
jgi:hypothetical protein